MSITTTMWKMVEGDAVSLLVCACGNDSNGHNRTHVW